MKTVLLSMHKHKAQDNHYKNGLVEIMLISDTTMATELG